MPRDYIEREFEKWFLKHPILPPRKERVLVIDRQNPLRRVVDLVALDKDGGLVIIEVKNEKSTRTVVGQSLEYLAQYQEKYVSVDTLSDLYEESPLNPKRGLADAFERTFGTQLSSVSSRRRVVIVARSFDLHSALCVSYLRQSLRQKVDFLLVEARKIAGGFEPTLFRQRPPCPAGKLVGKFGVSAQNWL